MTDSGARKLGEVSGGDGPARRRRGRPKTKLLSAVGLGGSELEVLAILRQRIAERLDLTTDLPTPLFSELVGQLLDVDARIRAINAEETG